MTHTYTHISLPDRSKLSVSLDVWGGNSVYNSLTVSAFFAWVSQSLWSRSDVKGSPASPAQQDGQWEQHFRASGKRVSVGTCYTWLSTAVFVSSEMLHRLELRLRAFKLDLLFRAVMTFWWHLLAFPHQLTYCLWHAVLEITAQKETESAVVKIMHCCFHCFHCIVKHSDWI